VSSPPVRLVVGSVRIVAAVVAVVAFGAGIPFAWVWIGSQFQGGTAPSFTGIAVTFGGIIGSYALLTLAFGWIKGHSSHAPAGPVRYAWNRSLSAERYQAGRNTTPLEDMVAAATILVGAICTIWFLLFGSPGVPTTP
jgi:hypothetical protein